MNARNLKAIFAGYGRRFPSEASIVARFIELLESSPAPFDRRNFIPGHFTASAWIIDSAAEMCLLVHHKKLEKWLQPGGHTDGSSDLLAAALREANEETGLSRVTPASHDPFDLDIHPIPARKDEPAHLHYDVRFLMLADSRSPIICSLESHELRWVPWARLPEFSAEDSLLRMAKKAL